MQNILIEGWRSIAHSYAVVNQFQILELLKRTNIQLHFRDIPFHNSNWQPTSGLFAVKDEQKIRDLTEPLPGTTLDIIYRIFSPLNVATSDVRCTWTMANAHWGIVQPREFPDQPIASAMATSNVGIIAPSNWSRNGFLRSGVAEDRVRIVPHGIDPSIYRPANDTKRQHLRERFKWQDSFVFMSVGAMTGNKGISTLLTAFSQVLRKHPQALLLLKGADTLYPSTDLLTAAGANLSPQNSERVISRMIYHGDLFSFSEMANIYQAADCYVSPYQAEGFNMPVLEAMACGLPSICTAGGATDDFAEDRFTLKIHSKLVTLENNSGLRLIPDLDHLIELMCRAIEDSAYMQRAGQEAARSASNKHTWKNVVDTLLETISEPAL